MKKILTGLIAALITSSITASMLSSGLSPLEAHADEPRLPPSATGHSLSGLSPLEANAEAVAADAEANAEANAETVAADATVLHVSPTGNDAHAGTAEEPLATLQGARDTLRRLRESGALSQSGAVVYIHGGIYETRDTAVFSAEDSGTATAPVTFMAYPNEQPVFSGGKTFGTAALTQPDSALAARIPKSARDQVLAFDMFSHGFTPSDIHHYNTDWISDQFANYYLSVFVNDQALYLSRYPNKRAGELAANPYSDYIFIEDEGGWVDGRISGAIEHPSYHVSNATAARMAGWQGLNDVFLSGMFSYEYYHEPNALLSYNPATQTIELARNASNDWDRRPETGKYYFENVLEELDSPGEFYVEKNAGVLLFYPPAGIAAKDLQLQITQMHADYMLSVQNASWLTFKGLSFELSGGSGIEVYGGSHVTIDSCTVKNMSWGGIRVGKGTTEGWVLAEYYQVNGEFPSDEVTAAENGKWHTIKICDVYNMVQGGIEFWSGQNSTRESGHGLVEDNIVSHCGADGLYGGGVGIDIVHNTAMYCGGLGGADINAADSEFAWNYLLDMIQDDSGDAAGLGLHHSNLNWGLKVHDNFIGYTNMTPARSWETWFDGDTPNRRAVYVDGNGPGMEFYRNIIYRAPVGFGMPDAGRFPSTYYNNIVIDALIPVLNDDYIDMNWLVGPDAPSREVILGESSASKGAGSYFVTDIYKTAWRYVYPEFYDFFDYYLNKKSNLTEQMSKVNNNLFVNISVPAIRPEPDRPYSQATPLPPDSLVVSDPLYGSYGNNRYLTHDPGFASYQTGDVQLSKAAAEDLGIEWIDVSAIGARRATSTPANDNESDNVGDNVSDSIASSNGGSSNGGSSSELPAVGDSLPYLFFAFSLLLCSGCLLIGRATQLRRAPRRLTKIRQRQA